MAETIVNHLLLQAKVLAVSALGILALLPGPGRDGELRIKGPLNNVVTYTGVVLLLAPWFALPFLPQPRYAGAARGVLGIMGVGGILTGVILYASALRVLLPAFRERFTEFTPGSLVTAGPYSRIRHPIYLACLVIASGLYLELGATLSILFLPLLFLVLRLVTLYEERVILEPKFGDAYREYRRRVPAALTGRTSGLAALVGYMVLAAGAVAHLLGAAPVPFIR